MQLFHTNVLLERKGMEFKIIYKIIPVRYSVYNCMQITEANVENDPRDREKCYLHWHSSGSVQATKATCSI